MTDPVTKVTLGGLTYNANQVKSAKDNGNGTYTISFKTGEKLTYPTQDPSREARIGSSIHDGMFYDTDSFTITHLIYLFQKIYHDGRI